MGVDEFSENTGRTPVLEAHGLVHNFKTVSVSYADENWSGPYIVLRITDTTCSLCCAVKSACSLCLGYLANANRCDDVYRNAIMGDVEPMITWLENAKKHYGGLCKGDDMLKNLSDIQDASWEHLSVGWPETSYTTVKWRKCVKDLPYGEYVMVGVKYTYPRPCQDGSYYDRSNARIRCSCDEHIKILEEEEGRK